MNKLNQVGYSSRPVLLKPVGAQGLQGLTFATAQIPLGARVNY